MLLHRMKRGVSAALSRVSDRDTLRERFARRAGAQDGDVDCERGAIGVDDRSICARSERLSAGRDSGGFDGTGGGGCGECCAGVQVGDGEALEPVISLLLCPDRG